MHVGVPGRVPGVDAASCKSVGYTGGTGDIFTNCHLLVFACGYLRYHVLLLCNPSYSGEYRINFISSLILPIFILHGLDVEVGDDEGLAEL